MATKTNKSYTKRLKITKNGKILVRATGQNHFNAKESSKTRLNKRKMRTIKLSAKVRSQFFPHS